MNLELFNPILLGGVYHIGFILRGVYHIVSASEGCGAKDPM